MRYGLRKFSLKKRIAARSSLKRAFRAKARMPRGMGVLTNPNKAGYNYIYNRTSVSIDRLPRSGKRKSNNTIQASTKNEKSNSLIGWIFIIILGIIFWPIALTILVILFLYFLLTGKKVK